MRLPVYYYIMLIALCFLFYSCYDFESSDTGKSDKTYNKSDRNESLVKVNKYLVNTENKEIDNYIKRHQLETTETGSGLKYQITKNGHGPVAQIGKTIMLDYKVKLITGDVVYSSDKDGPMTFKIGHGGVESGLEEAILHMRMGDEAIIIIPSHLGHGLLGDLKKIPQRSTIIYEISIINIK